MIFEISRYIKLKTMFNKLQIFNFKIMKLKKMINWYMIVFLYLDFNDNIIHQEFHIKKRIPKNLGKNKEQIVNLNIEDYTVNEKGNINKRTTKKEGFEEIIKNYQGEIGGGITIISIIGIISGAFFPPILPVSLLSAMGGIFFLWNKNILEKEENKKKTEKIMINEKIIDLIKNEFK